METVVINQIKDQSYTMKESLRALKTSISFQWKGREVHPLYQQRAK